MNDCLEMVFKNISWERAKFWKWFHKALDVVLFLTLLIHQVFAINTKLGLIQHV